MDSSYRLGLSIVVGTVVASALLCLATVGPVPAPARAGQDLGDHAFELGPFRLVERSGRVVTEADLAERVWIASFIFTHCPLSCPRITTVMKGLQGRLAGTDVQLVSLSVDPERDTPEVLAKYARTFGADAGSLVVPDRPEGRGPRPDHRSLQARRRRDRRGRPAGGGRGVLAQRPARAGRSREGRRLLRLERPGRTSTSSSPRRGAARGRARAWARRLPAVNATLNASSAVLLVLGWCLDPLRPGPGARH